MSMDVFEFSGRAFVVTYEGLTATNVYSSDGRSLTYEITKARSREIVPPSASHGTNLTARPTPSRGKKRTGLRSSISMISRRSDRFPSLQRRTRSSFASKVRSKRA